MNISIKQPVPNNMKLDYKKEDGPITEETRQRLIRAWEGLNTKEVKNHE